MKIGIVLLSMISLVGCSNLPTASVSRQVNAQSVQSKAVTNSSFSYSADKTELTIKVQKSNGESAEYKTTRRPANGSQITTQTVIKHNGNISRHASTTTEAQFIIKLAANNGWQAIYKDLKTRYELAGLVL